MEHLGPAFNHETTMKMFNQCVNQSAKEQPSNFLYVIKSKESNKKYGIIGLLWNQPEHTSVELGVMIAKSYLSKGYAYKALCLIMEHAFIEMKLTSIVILCSKNNTAVNRGVPTLGFQKVDILDKILSNKGLIRWEITLQRFNKIKKK